MNSKGALWTCGFIALALLLIGSSTTEGSEGQFSFTCQPVDTGILGILRPATQLECLQQLLIKLVQFSQGPNDITCSLVIGLLLSTIPPFPTDLANLLTLFTIGSNQCSLTSCGVNNNGVSGYWDIYCDLQCRAALYHSGQCRNNITEGYDYASCFCSGQALNLLGIPLGTPSLQTVFVMCQLVGNCACKTCLSSGSTNVKWEKGTCIQTSNPDGVLDYCSNPNPTT